MTFSCLFKTVSFLLVQSMLVLCMSTPGYPHISADGATLAPALTINNVRSDLIFTQELDFNFEDSKGSDQEVHAGAATPISQIPAGSAESSSAQGYDGNDNISYIPPEPPPSLLDTIANVVRSWALNRKELEELEKVLASVLLQRGLEIDYSDFLTVLSVKKDQPVLDGENNKKLKALMVSLIRTIEFNIGDQLGKAFYDKGIKRVTFVHEIYDQGSIKYAALSGADKATIKISHDFVNLKPRQRRGIIKSLLASDAQSKELLFETDNAAHMATMTELGFPADAADMMIRLLRNISKSGFVVMPKLLGHPAHESWVLFSFLKTGNLWEPNETQLGMNIAHVVHLWRAWKVWPEYFDELSLDLGTHEKAHLVKVKINEGLAADAFRTIFNLNIIATKGFLTIARDMTLQSQQVEEKYLKPYGYHFPGGLPRVMYRVLKHALEVQGISGVRLPPQEDGILVLEDPAWRYVFEHRGMMGLVRPFVYFQYVAGFSFEGDLDLILKTQLSFLEELNLQNEFKIAYKQLEDEFVARETASGYTLQSMQSIYEQAKRATGSSHQQGFFVQSSMWTTGIMAASVMSWMGNSVLPLAVMTGAVLTAVAAWAYLPRIQEYWEQRRIRLAVQKAENLQRQRENTVGWEWSARRLREIMQRGFLYSLLRDSRVKDNEAGHLKVLEVLTAMAEERQQKIHFKLWATFYLSLLKQDEMLKYSQEVRNAATFALVRLVAQALDDAERQDDLAELGGFLNEGIRSEQRKEEWGHNVWLDRIVKALSPLVPDSEVYRDNRGHDGSRRVTYKEREEAREFLRNFLLKKWGIDPATVIAYHEPADTDARDAARILTNIDAATPEIAKQTVSSVEQGASIGASI